MHATKVNTRILKGSEMASPQPVVLDGATLTLPSIAAVARSLTAVEVPPAVREAVATTAAVATAVAEGRRVYGRSTGVGANRVEDVSEGDSLQHALGLLRSHAGGAGDPAPAAEARAALVVRANQLAAAGSGARVEVLDSVVRALNTGFAPALPAYGGIGTGDLPALAHTALTLAGEREWLGGGASADRLVFTAGDALAFLSSNAATAGVAALAAHDLAGFLHAMHVVAGLSFVALGGNGEAYDERVAASRAHPGAVASAAMLRRLIGAEAPAPARLQDPFALRCAPQVLGTTLDASTRLTATLEVEVNAAPENPLFRGGDALHNGNFHAAPLAFALDAAKLALVPAGALSAARLAALCEPVLTGLPAFLAVGASGSSGVMILEYTANSALAEVRAAADPASRGSAVVSRGLEEHASHAWQAARDLRRALTALSLVTACELVAAVRALRLRGVAPEGPLRDAYAAADDVLSDDTQDRPLDGDVAAAADLLAGPPFSRLPD